MCKLTIESQKSLSEGYDKGSLCNRNGCQGIIDEHEKEGCCSCHVNPPCGYCTTASEFCDTCGWDAKNEQDELDRQQSEFFKQNLQETYEKQWKLEREVRELFYKKYAGELPVDKLEMIREGHTHFTMKIKGVFPKGTETYTSLLPKVKGTFGGRFNTTIDKDSFRFEYIVYSD